MRSAACLRERASGKEGFSLIELLLAAALSLIVIGGGLTMLITSVRSEPHIAERAGDVQRARVSMEALTREIRQGATVSVASGTQLALVTYVNSATCGGPAADEARPCLVTYSCSAGECTRTEANPDGSAPGPARVVVDGISTDPVFTFSPSAASPAHVQITLEFPAVKGGDSITLTDGATLRNAEAQA